MCDSSTDENSELGRRSEPEDFFECFLADPKPTLFPGHDCAYLYSVNYQNIDKLITRFGHLLPLSEADWDEERRIIWQKVKVHYSKVDESVPFSGRYTAVSKQSLLQQGNKTPKKKHNMKMRVRERFGVAEAERNYTNIN